MWKCLNSVVNIQVFRNKRETLTYVFSLERTATSVDTYLLRGRAFRGIWKTYRRREIGWPYRLSYISVRGPGPSLIEIFFSRRPSTGGPYLLEPRGVWRMTRWSTGPSGATSPIPFPSPIKRKPSRSVGHAGGTTPTVVPPVWRISKIRWPPTTPGPSPTCPTLR